MGLKSENTKDLILRESFKLFSNKPYSKVTFVEIQAATNLSRGALMYYFASKEKIFQEVVDKFLLQHQSIVENVHLNELSLKEFIESFIIWIEKTKNTFKRLNIPNMNYAMVNITNQALYYYKDFKQKAIDWNQNEVKIWELQIIKAVNRKEVRENIDVALIAHMFKDMYYGISYSGLTITGGLDTELLKREFDMIYNIIKV